MRYRHSQLANGRKLGRTASVIESQKQKRPYLSSSPVSPLIQKPPCKIPDRLLIINISG